MSDTTSNGGHGSSTLRGRLERAALYATLTAAVLVSALCVGVLVYLLAAL